MKTALTTIAIAAATLLSSTASAEVSNRYKFVAKDTAPETNICLIAAQEGYSAARSAAKEQGIHPIRLNSEVICNGVKVSTFARRYSSEKYATSKVSSNVVGNFL